MVIDRPGMHCGDEIVFILDCTPLTLVPLIPIEDDNPEAEAE